MKATIAFYLTILLRRVHWIILIFAIFTAMSVTIARILPPVYVSGTTLLVEPPQIPQNLAATTVQITPQEELQIIRQRLMTRVNLIDIARSEGVFQDMGTMSLDEVERQMRDATIITQNTGRNQATLMGLRFESDRATVAANVVNRYVTLILQENVRQRTEQAGNTLDFFESEVDRLGDELERQSAAILDFNNQNSDALPSTLNFRMNQQGTLQARAAVLERDIANLIDQRERLLEVFNATGSVAQATGMPQSPAQAKLAQLEQQLNDALAIYSENNPKVKLLQAQIEQQAAIVQEQVGIPAQSGGTGLSILDVQLADIDARVEVFRNDLADTQAQLDALSETIDRTPGVQIQLDALNRDYMNIQQQYNQAVAGLSRAATGERIELLAKGQRISVIDPATVPANPDRPNRTLIAAGGSLVGLLLGIALALGLELLNNSIRRPVEITSKLGITPLATIPYMRTPMEMVARRAMLTAVFLFIVVGIPTLLYAVHTYYLPLDLIYDRIASRIATIL